MSKRQWTLEYPGFTGRQVQMACLFVVGIIEFLLYTMNPLRPHLGEFMVEQFTVVPVLVFLGAALTQRQTKMGTMALILGGITVAWMSLTQCVQVLAWEGGRNISMMWVPYLLAFPFAAVTQDGERRKGLWILGGAAAACSLAAGIGGILLLLDALPNFLKNTIIWDKELRLVAFSHPNIGGWMLMIGICFTVMFGLQARKKWLRYGVWTLAGVELAVMALANSRASTLMTCAFIAGVVFFSIWKKGWKQFVAGLVAAVIVVVGLFSLSTVIYRANFDHQMRILQQEQQEEAEKAAQEEQEILNAGSVETEQENTDQVNPEQEAPQTAETVAQETEAQPIEEEQKLRPEEVRKRNSFWSDLASFTGRSSIWKASIQVVKDNPILLLRGTSHISEAVKAGGNPFGVLHTHNAWLEMLLAFGLPGLLLALIFTLMSIWGILRVIFRPQRDIIQVCVAMLAGCMLVAGILEPFLFTSYIYCHFYPVMFFLCNGYLLLWQKKPENT